MSLLSLILGVVVIPPAVVLSLLGYLGCCQLKNWIVLRNCHLPRAKERPFIGSLLLMQPHKALVQDHLRYGKTFLGSKFTAPVVSTSDPELIDLVLAKANFPKGTLHSLVEAFTGPNLVTHQHGENQPWKHHRRLADPAFRASYLRNLSGVLGHRANAFCDALAARCRHPSGVRKGLMLDLAPEIDKLTLGIVAEAGFGYNLRLEGVGAVDPFLSALQTLLASMISPLMILPFGPKIQRWRQRANFAIVDEVLYRIVRERLASSSTADLAEPTAPRDLLSALLKPDADGNALGAEQLRNELLMFFIAGHETTSTICSWTLLELKRHPQVLESLMDEIGSLDLTDEAPTCDQVANMPYLDMILNEILRKYPPAISHQRVIPEEFTFKGMTFPKGVTILLSAFVAQHDPNIWEDPHLFNPERFAAGSSYPAGAYAPFSLGARRCIGANFFFLEAKIILVTLLQRFNLTLDPDTESGQLDSSTGLLKINQLFVSVQEKR